MQCVILAGGLATRLRPVTERIPKSMIEIHGRPFLEYQIDLLKKNDVTNIVLCVGHLSEQIEAHFKDGQDFGVHIGYSREGDRLLSTGGALKKAENMLDPEFFVMYGDSYLPIDYTEVRRFFADADALGCMTVFRNRSLYDKSNIVFRDGILEMYDKKNYSPAMEHIDYGLTILSREVLNRIPADVVYDLADTLHKLAMDGTLAGYEVYSRFYEVGSFDGLRDFEHYIVEGGRE